MTAAPTTAVLWDLDGTILTTARAGVRALEDAAREVLRVEVDLSQMHTAGMTDRAIAAVIIERCGDDVDPSTELEFLRVYTERLPERLLERRGAVMPGVVEILRSLQEREDVLIALLTGNMRAGAQAKLAAYSLGEYFTDGGFADDAYERADIGRLLIERVARDHPGIPIERIFLVGDTPSDVRAGRAVGIKTIAVATGSYGVSELTAEGAWRVYERLPDPAEFLALLGLS